MGGGRPAAAERLGQADEGGGALGLGGDFGIARRKQLVFGLQKVAKVAYSSLILAASQQGGVGRGVARLTLDRHPLARGGEIDRGRLDFFERAEDLLAPEGERAVGPGFGTDDRCRSARASGRRRRSAG